MYSESTGDLSWKGNTQQTNQVVEQQENSGNTSTEDLADIQPRYSRRNTEPTLRDLPQPSRPLLNINTKQKRNQTVDDSTSAPSTIVSVPYIKPSHKTNRTNKTYAGINSKLLPLASPIAIPTTDFEYWEALLSTARYPAPTTDQEAYELDLCTFQAMEHMTTNNEKTGNFNTLLLYLLSQLRFMRLMAYDEEVSTETFNALFLVQIFVKHFTDNLNRLQIHEQFEMDRIAIPQSPSMSPRGQQAPAFDPQTKFELDRQVVDDKKLRAQVLLEELLHVAIYAGTNVQEDYDFYVQVLNLLLILFSTQLQKESSKIGSGNYFLDIVLNRLSNFSKGLVTRLLTNFIEQKEAPYSNGGVLFSAYSYLFASKKSEDGLSSALAQKSALLMLIVANQNIFSIANHYRTVYHILVDSDVAYTESEEDLAKGNTDTIQVSFRDMFHVICTNMAAGETSLLLYLLIVQNSGFKTYVLSRTDPESVLLPMLKIIYEAVDAKTNYSQVYILLIILLIFSQDDEYIETIQRVMIQPPHWYHERVLKSISLGGLSILILMRTIQSNLSYHRDIYFHTISIAALANLSMKIFNVHSTVAQRFVILFEGVSRRYQKLESLGGDEVDLMVYGDIVDLLLEITNSVMTYTLQHNPQLVYALLHRKEMFAPFRSHERFGRYIENIDTVITYYHSKLQEMGTQLPSTEEVLEMIEANSKVWAGGQMETYEDPKFQYEEDKEYDKFFLPYIWNLVYHHSLIHWDEKKLVILREFEEKEDIDLQFQDFAVPFK